MMNALSLLIPMTIVFQLDVAGGLFITELLLPVFALASLFAQKTIRIDHNFKIVVLACLAFLFCLILSDAWNETVFANYSRGWARIISFLLNFSALYIIANGHRKRLLLMAIGFALGRIWLSLEGGDGDGIPWKLGLAKPLALLLLAACIMVPFLNGRKNLLAPALIILFGLINIVSDYRSLGGVLVLTGVLMALTALGRLSNDRARISRATSVVTVVLACLCAGAIAKGFYDYSAENNLLSERAQSKYQTQAEQSELPLLVSGRSELLVSMEAILNAPILGHGSWPEDPYYAQKLAQLRYQYGLSGSTVPSDSDLIPTHSHLLGAWVEAGLGGAFFWLLVLNMIGKALARSARGKSHMRPIYIYCGVLLIWDILFSPFSGFKRLETAFMLVIVLRALWQRSISRRTSRSSAKRGRAVKRSRQRRTASARPRHLEA